ncbi:MAG: CDP-diacylglycerol--glycerol-3-phosphate 3-phosphatidyltransferase [Bacilli bacterium]|nr:CDP-diacylglycerol--glycerol-3-phosphate 3-phosphatidyltransferase [Bacilli bacterium]
MNLPTKLTIVRIIMAIMIIILMLFPFYEVGLTFPEYIISGVAISSKYIIAGILFMIASFTDFLDGYIARRDNLVTDTGKMLDAIADKILVNSVLIIFAADQRINAIVPVIIILRDIVVNAIKMEAASKGKVVAAIKSGKIKTASLMIGMVLIFASNLPFELIGSGIRVDLFFMYFATIMSLISLYEYFNLNKKIIFSNEK